ncbi:endonuclease/exonuclease/phosphatase family protein [Nocardioides mangrovi]|uniref:Endonuclease/exonuclease/phosphatase domain-containing protein n=1 Tax=Nocardioides mangrovi TaxID=2874580 RepID=A0ABS7UEB4_9ACTN|nr:endonuclease/exonuclease/phosphatase family protein [Nocardioides mangrovi]MBZ5739199.1 hypothetical protein [Nocardioides mangrovi]
MVRRVRSGRPEDAARPRSRSRWAGPPPLLLLATVLGFVVAPLVDQTASTALAQPGPATSFVSPRSVEPRIVRDPAGPHDEDTGTARAGESVRGAKPVEPAPIKVGVASYNMFRKISTAEAAEDARRLTSRPGVDVVGWQEAERFGGALKGIAGWRTQTFAYGQGISEVAISWRTDLFRLVKARQYQVAKGVSYREGSYPFGNRLVAVVTLAERSTGRILTVVNTHLPQKIEDFDDPGHWLPTLNAGRAREQLAKVAGIWRTADRTSRWVAGTGDFNFDARSDERAQVSGGPLARLGGRAVSSYEELGTDIGPTHPPTGRNIDYVWSDKAAVDDGRMQVQAQRVLSGYHSDHRPMVVQLKLD